MCVLECVCWCESAQVDLIGPDNSASYINLLFISYFQKVLCFFFPHKTITKQYQLILIRSLLCCPLSWDTFESVPQGQILFVSDQRIVLSFKKGNKIISPIFFRMSQLHFGRFPPYDINNTLTFHSRVQPRVPDIGM